MIEYGSQNVLRRLQNAFVATNELEPVEYAPSEFDLAPIDLQQFLASATHGDTGEDVSSGTNGIFLDYVSSSAVDLLSSTLQPVTADIFEDGQLPNYTYYNLYNNTTWPHLHYPPYDATDADNALSYAGNDNWTRICNEEFNPHLDSNRLEFWICGVMLNVVGILGILGNVISMIILSRPQMRSSINYLLIGLARIDTLLIITSMLLFGIPSVYPYSGHFFGYYNYVYPFISPFVYPIAMLAQTASIYMTFTVTLERYVAVCHPLRARALCTYGRAKIYFIVCVVFSLLYNLPRFWEVLMISYQPPGSEIVLHCLRPSPLRRNVAYINIYIHWCYLIVNYIIPFSTLAILNCLIYRQVKRANRERQRLSRSEKREIGLATMLICVVIVFFINNLLALVLNINEAFYNYIDDILTKVSNLLVTINSSVNFLIYIIFGEKFKRIFLLIFFKRRLSRDQPDLIHYESSISNNGDGTINHRSSGRFSRHGTQRSTTTYLVATGGGGGGGGGTGAGNGYNNSMMNNVRLTQLSGSGGQGIVKIKRNRAPSPGPVVYYPARELQRSASTTAPTLISNNNTALGYDWTTTVDGGGKGNKKSNHITSGF